MFIKNVVAIKIQATVERFIKATDSKKQVSIQDTDYCCLGNLWNKKFNGVYRAELNCMC
jgi:hypothetical protein